jgi:hypothetical protein
VHTGYRRNFDLHFQLPMQRMQLLLLECALAHQLKLIGNSTLWVMKRRSAVQKLHVLYAFAAKFVPPFEVVFSIRNWL